MASPTYTRRRPPERFGTREYEPYEVRSLAGGLDRSVRRSATDPGKWWEGEGFVTKDLSLVKSGGLRQITPLPLSNILQGYFERGCAYYVSGTTAYWDLFGFDLFALFAGSQEPSTWSTRFEWKLSRDPESYWTEIQSLGGIYEITFTGPVAPGFLPGEAMTSSAGWTARVIDYDSATQHLWIEKLTGVLNPIGGNVITGTTSGTVDTITSAVVVAVNVHFAGLGYPATEFGSPMARGSAGQPRRSRVIIRRKAGGRDGGLGTDIYVGESAPVQLLHRFVDTTSTKWLVASTVYQFYQSDGATPPTEADCRNPSYRVGGASFVTGGVAVAFVGGANLADATWPGPVTSDWLFKFNVDPDTHWTPVLQTTGAASLDLRFIYPGATKVNQPYTLKRRWQATLPPESARLNIMRALTWVHSLPERLVVLYNGIDPVMKWRPGIVAVGNAATNEVQPLAMTGLTTPVTAAKFAVSFKEHLVLGHYKQGSEIRDRGIRWSRPRNCESWRDVDFRDIDFQDTLEWLEIFRDTIVAFGKKNMVVFRYLGDPFWFGIQSRHEGIGTIAPGSIQNDRDQGVIFLGKDDIYVYDGIRPERIGQPIWDILKPLLNQSVLAMVTSCYDEEKSCYYLSIPTTKDRLGPHMTFKFDSVEKTWSRPFLGLSAFGHFESSDEGFIDDDDGIIDADDSLIDELIEETPLSLAGDPFGTVYELEGQLSQDGADIFSRFASGLTSCDTPAVKRIGWVSFEGEAPSTFSFYVLLSMDGRRVARAGPYNVKLDELPSTGRPAKLDRRIWINKRAKFVGIEPIHDRADESPVIDSVTFWHRPGSIR